MAEEAVYSLLDLDFIKKNSGKVESASYHFLCNVCLPVRLYFQPAEQCVVPATGESRV